VKRDADLDRQTYWSRPGPAGTVPSGDVDLDRPCGNCGYNLRGLPIRCACPECGAVEGITLVTSPLPFNDRHTPASYFATVIEALTAPGTFAQHVWQRQRVSLRSARIFRRINIAVAFLCFCIIIFTITERFMGRRVALVATGIDAIPVLLWLNVWTLDCLRFLKDELLLPRDPHRTETMAHYLSVWLVLSPIQLVGLLASNSTDTWFVAAGFHLFLLLLQLLSGFVLEGALLWQLIDIPLPQARFIAFWSAITRILTGAIYLAAIPALFAFVAKRAVGG
jgi:hypothetical protein